MSPALKYLILSSRTMDFSSTANILGDITVSWELQIDIPLQFIPKGTDKLKLVIVSGLKKRLDDAKGRWVEELPHVLWTYRTTLQRSIEETPFSMSYGAEAVIPLETGFPTLRTQSFNSSNNDELLERSLHHIEERRESVTVQLVYYQHKLK